MSNYLNIKNDLFKNSNYSNFNIGNTNSYKSGSSGLGISSDSGSMLTDYASIKNGSYKKLLKSYYKMEDGSTASVTKEDKKVTSDKYQSLKGAADDLLKSSKAITDDKQMFLEDADKDKMVGAVKKFAEDYNTLLKSYDEVNNTGILKKGVILTKLSDANEKLLNKVGITIGEGNKLEVNEEKLKSAKTRDITTLFKGEYSYANRVADKASQTSELSANAVNKINKLYTGSGTYASALNQARIMDAYF